MTALTREEDAPAAEGGASWYSRSRWFRRSREDGEPPPGGSVADPGAPLYRRSHPYRAFVIMTLPFLALPIMVFVPFVGWVILFVLLPIEFGRIGGRRLARNDALWVAVPAGGAVATWELALVIAVLNSIPGVPIAIDALGFVFTALVYGLNMFFFSVGALSTAFDPHEPVARDAGPAFAP